MEKIVRVPSNDFSSERFDTGFYSKDYYDARNKLDALDFPVETIGSVCKPWQFGAYALCSEIEWSQDQNDVCFIKAEGIESPLLNESNFSYVTKKTHQLLYKSSLNSGDIIVSTSGSVGRLAVIPESIQEANSNQDTIKFRLEGTEYDSYFVAGWLTSKYAQAYMNREAGGAVQQHIYLYNFKRLPLIKPNSFIQKYIGDKVRQAERLQAWVKELDFELKSLVINDSLESANETIVKKYNRVGVEDLYPRLDPKYYGNRSLSVLHTATSSSCSLSSLKQSICNGFEDRDFVDSGIDYVTVSEVSSGRIELSTAPKIAADAEIPDKARLNERCILVVRTGSIGTAVKVDARDKNVVISSHLIKLEFETEELAAAVAVFLNSASGKILQNKISYGAVQPQIGQDELLALPIPNFVLDNAEAIHACMQAKENAIRCSRNLTQSAKLFVEDLIEGQISEDELVAAQQALDTGDDSLDRALLERITAEGIDGDGTQLFDDIDQLYDLLVQADEAMQEA